MNTDLDDDFALEKTFKDASGAFPQPDGLKDRMRASLAGRATATRSHTWLWRCAAAAVAACVLIGLAVWMIGRPENRHDRVREERGAAGVVLPPPVAAKPADLPSADYLVYSRAWEESPDALDDLLTRDAAVLLRPEPIPTELNTLRFLQTMNQTKEKHNEKHSMRNVHSGAFV